jgi:hypothetical protein
MSVNASSHSNSLVNGQWEKFGSVEISLDGYFNETNLTPITNAEIDQMIASLAP